MSAIRHSTYEDYNITKSEKEFIVNYCQSVKADKDIIRECAESANNGIAEYITQSLIENKSYDNLGYVPINKGDFYAYRRKTLYLIKQRLVESGILIIIGGNIWSWN